MHPGAGSGAACVLGAGVATGPVTCRDGQGLWAAVPLGKGAIPCARRSPATVREQQWAGKDGASALGHRYLPFSGRAIAPAWQKSVLGAKPAGLGQALFPSCLWSSC